MTEQAAQCSGDLRGMAHVHHVTGSGDDDQLAIVTRRAERT